MRKHSPFFQLLSADVKLRCWWAPHVQSNPLKFLGAVHLPQEKKKVSLWQLTHVTCTKKKLIIILKLVFALCSHCFFAKNTRIYLHGSNVINYKRPPKLQRATNLRAEPSRAAFICSGLQRPGLEQSPTETLPTGQKLSNCTLHYHASLPQLILARPVDVGIWQFGMPMERSWAVWWLVKFWFLIRAYSEV